MDGALTLVRPDVAALLAGLERARSLVSEARTVDEAKDLADKAEALRVWARKARYGLDIQNDCAEIRLRADRRIGELTREMEHARPGPAPSDVFQGETQPAKGDALKAAGLTRLEAHRNEQLAAIPAEVFERHIAETKGARKELTKVGVMEIARRYRPAAPRRPEVVPLPGGVVVVDEADPERWPDAPVVLVRGDARSSYPENEGRVDLFVTSPPYGVGIEYGAWSDAGESWADDLAVALEASYLHARDGGRLALNVPLDTTRGGFRPTYAQAVYVAEHLGEFTGRLRCPSWDYRATIVWNEGNVAGSTGRGSQDSPNSPHVIAPVEMVALFSKGAWDQGRVGEPCDLEHDEWLAWTNGLWTFPGESRPWEGHPAPFPEELPRRLIKLLSFPGDLVCDPFVGSGTTALAAYRLGRRFVGLDLDPACIESASRRLALAGEPA